MSCSLPDLMPSTSSYTVSAPRVVHPVAGAEVELSLYHAAGEQAMLTGFAIVKAPHAHPDSRLRHMPHSRSRANRLTKPSKKVRINQDLRIPNFRLNVSPP